MFRCTIVFANYERIYGRLIELTIVYDVDDRELATNVLIKQFVQKLWNERSMQLKIRIRWIPRCKNELACYGARIHECVQDLIDDPLLTIDYIVCHALYILNDTRDADDERLFGNCANKMYFMADLKIKL